MNIGAAERAIAIGVFLTGLVTTTTATAADEIRDGKWQFTTEMQMPTTAPAPTGVQAAGQQHQNDTDCVYQSREPGAGGDSGDVQCKVDKMGRDGGTVTWAMTCTPRRGTPVRSNGVAHYVGTTMQGTFTTHMTAPNGTPSIIPGVYQAAISEHARRDRPKSFHGVRNTVATD